MPSLLQCWIMHYLSSFSAIEQQLIIGHRKLDKMDRMQKLLIKDY